MAALKRATGKPVTTSEPIHRYLGGPDRQWLLENSDWLFPIAHPYLALGHGGEEAVQWVVARYDYLSAASEKLVILKETGVPTQGGACCSQTAQLEFFRSLSRKGVSFYFFEAFDQPHKRPSGRDPEPEHHWGLYLADGTPKKVVDWLTKGNGDE
jgi:exo-beta-1,3-glucanase (GH17 family)